MQMHSNRSVRFTKTVNAIYVCDICCVSGMACNSEYTFNEGDLLELSTECWLWVVDKITIRNARGENDPFDKVTLFPNDYSVGRLHPNRYRNIPLDSLEIVE